jgi:hypothetical protein
MMTNAAQQADSYSAFHPQPIDRAALRQTAREVLAANAQQQAPVTLHFHPWFTGAPVTTYDEAADALPVELEDNIDWLEVGDYCRIDRLVAPADDAEPSYGTIRRVNANVQYALVELEVSGYFEWFSVEEVFLVLKKTAAALTAEAASATA